MEQMNFPIVLGLIQPTPRSGVHNGKWDFTVNGSEAQLASLSYSQNFT